MCLLTQSYCGLCLRSESTEVCAPKQGSAVLNSLMRDDVDTEVSLQTGALVCVISFGLFALPLVSSADLSFPLSEAM